MNKKSSDGSGLGLDTIGNLSSLLNDTPKIDENTKRVIRITCKTL